MKPAAPAQSGVFLCAAGCSPSAKVVDDLSKNWLHEAAHKLMQLDRAQGGGAAQHAMLLSAGGGLLFFPQPEQEV